MEAIKLPSKETLQNGLDTVIDYVISTDYTVLEAYVDKLREQNTGISCDKLAHKILNRKSVKNGLVGAVTGLGGFIALPISVFLYRICLRAHKRYNRFKDRFIFTFGRRFCERGLKANGD